MGDLTELEQIVRDTLADWNGWPSGEWLIRSVMRKHHRSEQQVTDALNALCALGIVAKVKHKDEIVFRME